MWQTGSDGGALDGVQDDGDEESEAGTPHSAHGSVAVVLVGVLLGLQRRVAGAAAAETVRF